VIDNGVALVLGGDIAASRDFASITSTPALALPYSFLEAVMTSCRRAAAEFLSGSAGNGTLKLKS
jgi:hypothetical protein